ncbi:transglycosylase domain-containing protein [candidate division WOR-3 bacterium]|nr:transglycosylase domain-containing protein [candidate division WOR-3 bacterium]
MKFARNELLSRGISASEIIFELPLNFFLTDVTFDENSFFCGGNAETVQFSLSITDPRKLKSLSIENFVLPIRASSKNGVKTEKLSQIDRFPGELTLRNGVFLFSGKHFDLDSLKMKKEKSYIKGYISSNGLMLYMEIRDSCGIANFVAESKDTLSFSELLEIRDFSLRGQISGWNFKGVFKGVMLIPALQNSCSNIDDSVYFNFQNSSPEFQIPGLGAKMTFEENLIVISLEDLYLPVKELSNLEVVDYKFSGKLKVKFEDGTAVFEADSIKLNDIRLFSKFLCSDTLTFSEILIPDAFFHVNFSDRWVFIENLVLALGNSDIKITSFFKFSDSSSIHIELSADSVYVSDLIDFTPKELLPNIQGIRGGGYFDLSAVFDYTRCFPESTDFRINSNFHGVEIYYLGSKLDIDSLSRPFSATVRIGSSQGEKIFLGPQNPNFVPLANLPKSLIGAVIVCEDGSFFSHRGFSQFHIRRAMRENLSAGRYISGGSTITMQLARNLFLSDERSLSRKLEEAVLTWQLEHHLSKNRILELYLNIIEFGPNIRGIQEASRIYFGIDASELNPLQASYFASIIPNPKRYYRLHYQTGGISAYWQEKIVKIMKLELDRSYIDSTQFDSFSSLVLEFTQKE